jgi:hypothetical protein
LNSILNPSSSFSPFSFSSWLHFLLPFARGLLLLACQSRVTLTPLFLLVLVEGTTNSISSLLPIDSPVLVISLFNFLLIIQIFPFFVNSEVYFSSYYLINSYIWWWFSVTYFETIRIWFYLFPCICISYFFFVRRRSGKYHIKILGSTRDTTNILQFQHFISWARTYGCLFINFIYSFV